MPVFSRGWSAATDLATVWDFSARPPATLPATVAALSCSSSVFHSPHCAHRPLQLLLIAPQLLQTYLVAAFFAKLPPLY
jgi:hypothetical protein